MCANLPKYVCEIPAKVLEGPENFRYAHTFTFLAAMVPVHKDRHRLAPQVKMIHDDLCVNPLVTTSP